MADRRRKLRKTESGLCVKAESYQSGIFSFSYDLRGIVELLGVERTIAMVHATQRDIDRDRAKSAKSKHNARKVTSNADKAMNTQLSDTVLRTLQHYKVKRNANKKVTKT